MYKLVSLNLFRKDSTMGGTRWDAADWAAHVSTTAHKPREAVFTSHSLDTGLDPSKFKFRESVDSDNNPKCTPIIISVDVTGSMGALAEQIIKRDLGVVMSEIYTRKPVSDPHVCIGAIGDGANGDNAPIQVTQFESEVGPLTSQIEKIYLEGGGGGNMGESYAYPWYFAANKTKCDAITKRHRKGYLFTIGDEAPLMTISKSEISRYFGEDVEKSIDTKDLLELTQKNWEVFHIVVETASTKNQDAIAKWKDLLGQRVIVVPSSANLAEVIVSTIQVIEGEDASKVADSWDGSTAISVRNAIKDLDKKASDSGELVRM